MSTLARGEATMDKPGAVGRRPATPAAGTSLTVALVTGGFDRPYTYGLAPALAAAGLQVEIVGGEGNECPEFSRANGIRFHNFRRGAGNRMRRLTALLAYYLRLLAYAAGDSPKLIHILWNNRFQAFDRTLLMFYYRALGKRVFLTAHNVNAAARDGDDTPWNRLTLHFQYRLAERIFVHTERMRRELGAGFGVPADKITVIPFGINNSLPQTGLTPEQARARLGLGLGDRVILFFGNIRPYKGLEYLAAAFRHLALADASYRLVIAGECPPGNEAYWRSVREDLSRAGLKERVLAVDKRIPDAEAEAYFKAADVIVLPYTHIFQSGVLFAALAFGLPAIVADVGELAAEIREGENGFVCPPRDAAALAAALERYFASPLFGSLASRRPRIAEAACLDHSWAEIAHTTAARYAAPAERQAEGQKE